MESKVNENLRLNLKPISVQTTNTINNKTSLTTPLLSTNSSNPNTPNTISNSLKIQELLNKGNLDKNNSSTNTASAVTAPPATTTTLPQPSKLNSILSKNVNIINKNNEPAMSGVGGTGERFKSEAVRKNWKTVLDVAMKKKNELLENEMSTNLNSSLNARSFMMDENREIYATDKENWVYFSIILIIVIALSVLFSFIVYSFFPQFRARYMF
jgi:hypothetical protein